MYKCSKVSCSESATFSCICRNEHKYFCQTDLIIHLGDTGVKHDPRPIVAKNNESVKSIVLASLSTLKSKIQHKKKQIIDDISRSITLLEESCIKAICNLCDFEKSIEKAIADIYFNIEELENTNLKKTLTMTLDQAREECKDWNLVKVYINSEDLQNSINKWLRIDTDLQYLFTSNPRSVKSKESVPDPFDSIAASLKAIHFTEEAKHPRITANTDAPGNAYPTENDPKVVSLQTPPHSIPPYPSAYPIIFTEVPRPQESLSSPLAILRCSRNHVLKWSVVTPFAYYQRNKSFWISCDNCHTLYSKSGWNCLECMYDICEACGLNAGAGCPKLKCTNNHELLWKSDVSMYYESKGKGHNFLCKRCNARKDETHWHCRECKYDICQDCGSEQNYPPIIDGITCPQFHSLQKETRNALLTRRRLKDISCDRCKHSFAGKCYTCEQCSYVLCGECRSFLKCPAAGHPVIRCQTGHLLRWIKKRAFFCNCCEKNMTQERYKCKQCDFDMCAECSNALLRLIFSNTEKTHGAQSHPLAWNPNPKKSNGGNPVFCNTCGVQPRRGGMFSCKQCSNNYCVLCCDNPNRVSYLYSGIIK